MLKRDIYKEEDFVYYVGNNPISYGQNRIAQIDSIEKTESYWKLKLILFDPTERVYCLNDLVRPIFTEKQHLINLDFVEEKDSNGRTIFKIENLIVSGLYLNIASLRLNYNTGYRVGDLREMTEEKFSSKYIVSGEIDFDKFQSDFPTVANINDLTNVYSKYFDFNINKIFR
jgi:hypothetical protein